MALIAWGTDLMREDGAWTIRNARRYSPTGRTKPLDPFQMRLNAYRVLLTRGRDGEVIFIPTLPELDETYTYVRDCGIPELPKP